MIRTALSKYHVVVVVLGSAFQAPSPANPFSWQQRAEMIGLCLVGEERLRVRFVPVRDYHRDDFWAHAVREAVATVIDDGSDSQLCVADPEGDDAIDSSFDYGKLFHHWSHQSLPHRRVFDETSIRQVLFSEIESMTVTLASLQEKVPDEVRHYLSAWWQSPLRAKLAAESAWVGQYRKQWPVEQSLTTDAVVTCAAHVLLIERSEGAGAGLFAVPGGFLDKHERFFDGAKRELREETNLDMPDNDLDKCFVEAEIFDRPHRSLRARIVTVAHLFNLQVTPLPEVQGRDDARRALWTPIRELIAMEDRFFEDHFQILDHFLALSDRPAD